MTGDKQTRVGFPERIRFLSSVILLVMAALSVHYVRFGIYGSEFPSSIGTIIDYIAAKPKVVNTLSSYIDSMFDNSKLMGKEAEYYPIDESLIKDMPTLIGIVPWDNGLNDTGAINNYPIFITDDIINPLLYLKSYSLPEYSRSTPPDTYRLRLYKPIMLEARPIVAVAVERVPDKVDSMESGAKCILLFAAPNFQTLWYLINLVYLAIILKILAVFQMRQPRPAIHLMAISLLVFIMSISYSLLYIPFIFLSMGFIKLSLMAYHVSAMLRLLLPDVPLLLIAAWGLYKLTNKWPSLRFIIYLLLLHYILNVSDFLYNLHSLFGPEGMLSPPPTGWFYQASIRVFTPQIFSSIGVATVGIALCFASIRLRRKSDELSQRDVYPLALLMLTLFLVWAGIQPFYGKIPPEQFFSFVFSSKALALGGYALFAFGETVVQFSRRYSSAVLRQKRHSEHARKLAETAREQVEQEHVIAKKAAEMAKHAQERLQKVISVDSIVLEIHKDLSVTYCSTAATGHLRDVGPVRQATLEDVLFSDVEKSWIINGVINAFLNTDPKSLYGFEISLVSKLGRRVICQADLTYVGLDNTIYLLMARPVENVLFESAIAHVGFHNLERYLSECQRNVEVFRDNYPQFLYNENFSELYSKLNEVTKLLARAEDVRQQLRQENVICNLGDVIGEIKNLKMNGNWGNINIIWPENSREVANVKARMNRLIDIFIGLLDNVDDKAIKSKKHLKACIRIRSTDEQRVLISIEDNGKGFKPEHINRFSKNQINMQYVEGPESHGRESNRLGLQSAYFFARFFGGKLWVTNEGEKSTVPTVWLQLWKIKEANDVSC